MENFSQITKGVGKIENASNKSISKREKILRKEEERENKKCVYVRKIKCFVQVLTNDEDPWLRVSWAYICLIGTMSTNRDLRGKGLGLVH